MNPFLQALSQGAKTLRHNNIGGSDTTDANGNIIQHTEHFRNGGLNVFDANHNMVGMTMPDLHGDSMSVIGEAPFDGLDTEI
jgi:hypothetical protein